MIAVSGQFALNFLRGVLATVNPCGFVLLPTYLMFFLGTEGARPGTQRASVQRALTVSAAVTAGFFAVFLVIGLLEMILTWTSSPELGAAGLTKRPTSVMLVLPKPLKVRIGAFV